MNIQKNNYYYRIDVDQFLIAQILYLKVVHLDRDRNHYNYKVISHEIDRRFEIPETEEERLIKKYNKFPSYTDERQRGAPISGGGIYEEGDLLDSVTEEDILKKIEERREMESRRVLNALRCPITGGRLICLGSDINVMDGPITWIVEGHENMKWYVDPRRSSVFQGHGYYKWDQKKGVWVEQIKIYGGSKFVNKPQTQEEKDKIDQLEKEWEEKKKKDKEEYERKVASGEITPLLPFGVKQIHFKTLNLEDVNVSPLPPPSGTIFYVDYKINNDE